MALVSHEVSLPGPPGLSVLADGALPQAPGALTRVGASRSGRLYGLVAKPTIDFLGALVLFLVLLPVMLTVAVAVRLRMGKGVIYRQPRVGLGGSPFTMYKFRSMTPDRRKAQVPFDGVDRRVCHKRDDDPRHTSLGRFLRKSRFDELPQLWNVLMGHMSLVGPRPELPAVVDGYQPWQHERHQVKPGLTGYWQVSPRAANGLAFEGVDLDIDYLRDLSFVTDCRVLLRTVPVAMHRTGH